MRWSPKCLAEPRGSCVLYVDKPPDRSWALPWHNDQTIAVKRNDIPSQHFAKPTRKAGVPHVEAAATQIQTMLTLRIHVDAMCESNGPLCVISGSHHLRNAEQLSPVELHADRGDVLAMRPLISHASRLSSPETTLQRRVIHLELAAAAESPDGYEWHTFLPEAGAFAARQLGRVERL